MTRRGFWTAILATWALGLGFWLFSDSYPFGVGPVGYLPFRTDTEGSRHPGPVRVEADGRPGFRIDPGRPWQITLGRGSGWHGLDTMQLDHAGRLVLCRQQEDYRGTMTECWWEQADAQLTPDAVEAILEATAATRLTGLARSYSAVNVRDGTQWVLLIRQGDRETAVYFDNHFPAPIRRFGRRVDEVIAGSVGPDLRWRRVPPWDAGGHDRELWDAIRQ